MHHRVYTRTQNQLKLKLSHVRSERVTAPQNSRKMIAANLLLVFLSALCAGGVRGGEAARGGNISFPEVIAYDPVADPSAVVTSGQFRATVLTDNLVRFEWSDGQGRAESGGAPSFEDRATTAFLNRKLPVPKFTQATQNGVLVIETQALTIKYTVGKPLAPDTLTVTPSASNDGGAFRGWHYGQHDDQNLLGTIKSLDLLGPTTLNCSLNANITVHSEDLHCEYGLISRSGWAVVDDSDTYALDENGWWQAPNSDATDIYLFAHGHDYKAALQDFVSVSGSVAMKARAAIGVWWTRWFNMNAPEVRAIVDDYRTRSLPLDVFVLDMDWHVKPAWGAYSFDRNLFPDPADTLLDYVKEEEGLITLANLHDDNGVVESEDEHDAMVSTDGPSATRINPGYSV